MSDKRIDTGSFTKVIKREESTTIGPSAAFQNLEVGQTATFVSRRRTLEQLAGQSEKKSSIYG
jgi:hypothetical protein